MKTSLKYNLAALALVTASFVNAQQNSLFNTYSMDPLQLNIAYAGAGCTEANLHYRTQWLGLKETPKVFQINAQTALGKSNGVGLRVNSQTMGLLNTLGATVGYSYRFNVTRDAKVHLGIGVGWSQAAINSQKAVVIDANDNTINNNNRQTANGFDSEFGAMLIGNKIKAGVSALHLYNSNPSFVGAGRYKALPQLNTQLSYVFLKGQKIEVEPWVLNRYTIKGDNVVEGMLNVNFMKVLTVGAGYRTNYGIMALLGARIGNLKLAYSFDYGSGKNATNLGSSHQVMLGFSMCRSEKQTPPAEESATATQPPAVLPTVVADLDKHTAEAPKEESVSLEGAVKTGENPGTPLKNKKIIALTESGYVIGETTTNNSGAFAFRKVPANQNFLVKVDEGEEPIPDGTKVSLTTLNGKEEKSYVKSKDDNGFKVLGTEKELLNDMKADDASLTMNITGYLFDQDQKPITNAHIRIKEEDGSNERRLVTDQTGKFNCSNLDADKTYIMEAEENDPAFAGLSAIKFANIKGKVYRVVELGNGKFAFKLLDSDKNALGEFRVEDTQMAEAPKKEEAVVIPPPVVSAEPIAPAPPPVDVVEVVNKMNNVAEDVVFGFNETQLNEAGLKKLDNLAALLNQAPEIKINIIGHSCNIGTKEANDLVSIRRATYVRNELIKRGVNAKNIDRSIGVGAEQELYDNNSLDSQRKNRTIRFELSK